MRIALSLSLVAAISCGPRAVRDDGSAAESPPTDELGPSELPSPTAVAHLALEMVSSKGATSVRIVVTDEVGSTQRERVGEFEGACSEISKEVASDSLLLGARCDGGRGVLLHVVYRAPTVTVLRDWTDDDEELFDPIYDFLIPTGIVVSTDFQPR